MKNATDHCKSSTTSSAITSLLDPYKGIRKSGIINVESSRNVELIPEVIKCLDDPFWIVREQAALSLGEFGKDAVSAVPKLEEKLNDHYRAVYIAAKEALSKISGN